DRVAQIRSTASKVGVKVRQRLKESARAPVGAPMLAQRALDAMVDERLGLEGVAALPGVSREYIEDIFDRRAASPATVGLLVALRGLVRDVGERDSRQGLKGARGQAQTDW